MIKIELDLIKIFLNLLILTYISGFILTTILLVEIGIKEKTTINDLPFKEKLLLIIISLLWVFIPYLIAITGLFYTTYLIINEKVKDLPEKLSKNKN